VACNNPPPTDRAERSRSGAAGRGRVDCVEYARHGRELMGLKSSVCEPRYYDSMVAKVLAEGKGIIARWCLKEAGVQSCELTCLRADAQENGQK